MGLSEAITVQEAGDQVSFHSESKVHVEEGSVVACMIESRGSATEVGMVILDMDGSCCHLYQYLDTPTYQHSLRLLNLHRVTNVQISDNQQIKEH